MPQVCCSVQPVSYGILYLTTYMYTSAVILHSLIKMIGHLYRNVAVLKRNHTSPQISLHRDVVPTKRYSKRETMSELTLEGRGDKCPLHFCQGTVAQGTLALVIQYYLCVHRMAQN